MRTTKSIIDRMVAIYTNAVTTGTSDGLVDTFTDLPTVTTGRLAVKARKGKAPLTKPVLNTNGERRFYTDLEPSDFDSSLKGYSWEVVTGKSGTSFKTRYFVEHADRLVEVESRNVREYDGIRYYIGSDIDDINCDSLSSDEVLTLLMLRGKSALGVNSAKWHKLFVQTLSLLKDSNSRPTLPEDRAKFKAFIQPWYAKVMAELNNEKIEAPGRKSYGVDFS